VANAGAFDDVKVENVSRYEKDWHEYVNANLPDIMREISETGELSDENQQALDEAVKAFKSTIV
jgi:F-type H+-transporting ATPase subunit alpha